MTTDRERLPPKCRAKIFTLADQEAAVMTAINSNLRHINEIGKAHDMASDEQRKLELKEETGRRQDVLEGQRERHRALADLNAKVRRFLDLLPADSVVEDQKPPKVKLKHGQTYQQAVAELRGTIMQLIAERSQVERVALPTEEIKAQLKKFIVEAGLRAKPTIIANHEKFEILFHARVENAPSPTLDIVAALAWFDPEHLEAKLLAQIDEMPRPKLAMTPLEKSQRLAAIKVELADAERLECALIADALDAGVMIDHRPNVSIPVLLGLSVSKKKANAA